MSEKSVVSQIMDANIVFERDERPCSNSNCQTEIQQLKVNIDSAKREISIAAKKYHETLILNLKKDIKMKELKSILPENQFDEFANSLPTAIITELKCIKNVPEKDSNFILKIVKGLYRDDLNKLNNKTFGGRKKEALTPTKKELIKKMYTKRLTGTLNSKEREANFGRHVKNAIETIKKQNK